MPDKEVTRKAWKLRKARQIILVEALPAGSVIEILRDPLTVAIVRRDGRKAWFDPDGEASVCLTSRAVSG